MVGFLFWRKELIGCSLSAVYTFNRQKPLKSYIVDFYCKPLHLVIEVEGGYYFEEKQMIRDRERQNIPEDLGLNFLRFHDEEIRKDMPQVLQKTRQYMEVLTTAS